MHFKNMEKYLFTSILSFLAIWLYLISPVNMKIILPDISPCEYSFISVKFYFFLVWSALFLYFYKFFKSKYINIFYPYLIWNILFFIIALNISVGFDITDEGWQIAKSWGILNGSLADNADLIWGSSFISGIWLNIINTPLLLWSRLGYLLFLPFFGVVIYLILINYFPRKPVFFSVLTAFLLFDQFFLIFSVINYYYLPVFAALISFLFLVKFHKSELFSAKFLILSGLIAGVSIHLKFTFVLIIPVFLLYFISFYVNKTKISKSLLIFYGSLFTSILIGFIIIMIFGGIQVLIYEHNRLSIFKMFTDFFGNSPTNSNLNYSASFLLQKYYNDCVTVIKDSYVMFAIFFLGSYLSLKNNKLKYVVITFSGIFLYLSIWNYADSHLRIIEMILSSSVLLLLLSKNDKKEFIFLSFIFLSVFLLSFLGSGTSLYGGIFSLGFFGFSALCLTALLTYSSEIILYKTALYSIVIFVFITQFFTSYLPNRDLPSLYLNTMFQSPELFGIYSFRERVDTVDELISFSKSEFLESDRVIFVSLPMFYYLLDIKPIISETSDVILGFEQLKKEVINANPNIIVVPVQSPRGTSWPLEQNADFLTKDAFERSVMPYYQFYNDYLTENHFKRIFSNKMFIVYRKTDFLKE